MMIKRSQVHTLWKQTKSYKFKLFGFSYIDNKVTCEAFLNAASVNFISLSI